MELTHEFFMKHAIRMAEKAMDLNEVPIGAVVVIEDQIIGKGYNQTETLNDPTAHAEMIAITAACNFLASKNLEGCELYVTVEPCLMCFGALQHSRIKKLHIALREPKTGFSNFVNSQLLKHYEIGWGIYKEESKSLMQTFFKSKRN